MLADVLGYCLIGSWSFALENFRVQPSKECDLIARMAIETPKLVETWWSAHQHMIPAWKTRRVYEQRAMHLTLLGDIATTSRKDCGMPDLGVPVILSM